MTIETVRLRARIFWRIRYTPRRGEPQWLFSGDGDRLAQFDTREAALAEARHFRRLYPWNTYTVVRITRKARAV